jgi:hypothetical protein
MLFGRGAYCSAPAQAVQAPHAVQCRRSSTPVTLRHDARYPVMSLDKQSVLTAITDH